MFKGIIAEKGFKRLLLIVLGIFFFFSLLSALLVYRSSHISLSPHYGATYVLLTRVKESLIAKTIKINLIFYLLSAAGITLLGILYSHRIAGPLFKVKQYAAMLGEGRFNQSVHFRKKDAVHTLASVLNDVAKECRDKTEQYAAELKKLEEGLLLLGSMPDGSKERNRLIKNLLELDARIKAKDQKLKT